MALKPNNTQVILSSVHTLHLLINAYISLTNLVYFTSLWPFQDGMSTIYQLHSLQIT